MTDNTSPEFNEARQNLAAMCEDGHLNVHVTEKGAEYSMSNLAIRKLQRAVKHPEFWDTPELQALFEKLVSIFEEKE